MVIPNFFVLHFGENFIKIGTKIAKVQMHDNLHKNVNENIVPNFDDPNTFFHKFNRPPGPDYRNVGKSLSIVFKTYSL